MKIVKFRGSRKLLDLRISTELLFCSFYQPQGMNQENDWIKMGIAIIFPLKHHPLKVCDCDCIIFQQTLSYKIKNKTNWFHQHFFQYQFLSIKKLKCLCYYYCPQIYLALKTLKDTIINKNNSHTRERRTTCIQHTFCHLTYWVFSEQIIYVNILSI